MKKIKLVLVGLLLALLANSQSIDNILNSTLLGLNKQEVFQEVSTRLDSTWKYNFYKDDVYGDILYVYSNIDSSDKYFIKYTWAFDEYELAYAFNSIEYYGDKTDESYDKIKEKLDKYGHHKNKKGDKNSYVYYVNNYHPIEVAIDIVKYEIEDFKIKAVSYSLITSKPKNLKVFYDIFNIIQGHDEEREQKIDKQQI